MTSSSKSLKYYHMAAVISALLLFLFGFSFFRLWREKLIDLLFTGAKPSGEVVIIAIDEESISEIGQWPWPRAVFASAVQKLQAAKVVGIDVNFKESSSRGLEDDAMFSGALRNSNIPIVLSAEITADGEINYPLDIFKPHSRKGFTNINVATDGVVRNFAVYPSLLYKIDSFANQIVWQFYDQPDEGIENLGGRIHYFGHQGSFATLSFRDILNGKIPGEFIRGKIILIGATASDLQDYHQTPVGIMSGIEIQANILQTFLDGKFYRSSKLADMALIIALSFFVSWLCFRIKKFGSLAGSLILVFAGYNLIAFLSFNKFFILDLFYPNLAVMLSAGASVSYQYVAAQKEKKFIKDSFGYYLAPQIVDELIRSPEKLKLGGEKRKITVLFSDIRDFTSISEKMPPEQLAKFINKYLTAMSEIIMAGGGLIDKYIGDAVMAFWGVPLDNPNQVIDAVLTARKMIQELGRFNEENKKEGLPTINIGVGIHAGEAVVGNMGSERRFDYTALGDTVNLASRLEGLNKNYKTNIIVSQAVMEAIDEISRKEHGLAVKELDRVQVKGRDEPVTIYSVGVSN